MLDVKFIRENANKVKKACRNKGIDIDIDQLLEIDGQRKQTLLAIEDMRAKKNIASKEIAQAKDENQREKLILEMKELDENNDNLKKKMKDLEENFYSLMRQIPNIPFDDVPIGKSSEDNDVLRKVGEPTKFSFKPREHFEIGEELDIIDADRGAKVAGSRFSYLKGDIVLLEFAIINFVMEKLVKKGFTPIIPPVMLREEMARGTGFIEAADRNEAYYLQDDNMYLIATSEQAILSMHSNETFNEKDLPKRYVGFSTCFRREAGSYGKDTKGILRVHQFDKLEMFSFCHPENSRQEHEMFLAIEEEMMKELGLPYRVINICTGDLGFSAAKKYDIEAWLPGQNEYRETHSTSNCIDFQTRRLNIRYRDKEGKTAFVHAVNGTAFALGRIMITIMENYQQEDGSILIPEVLQKYTGFKIIIKK
ncbi:serine--tRNA ligase [Candidatus Parcubacteria bacterium A4]|nr:MAG: serine--tRNA ligase [Candidatus Parcubacteria bacterium A4]